MRGEQGCERRKILPAKELETELLVYPGCGGEETHMQCTASWSRLGSGLHPSGLLLLRCRSGFIQVQPPPVQPTGADSPLASATILRQEDLPEGTPCQLLGNETDG